MNYEYRIIETERKPSWYYNDIISPSKMPTKFYIAQFRKPTETKKHWFRREEKIEHEWQEVRFNSKYRILYSCSTKGVVLLENKDGYEKKYAHLWYDTYDGFAATIDDAKEAIKQHKSYYNPNVVYSDRVVYEETDLTKAQIEKIIEQYTELLKTK